MIEWWWEIGKWKLNEIEVDMKLFIKEYINVNNVKMKKKILYGLKLFKLFF